MPPVFADVYRRNTPIGVRTIHVFLWIDDGSLLVSDTTDPDRALILGRVEIGTACKVYARTGNGTERFLTTVTLADEAIDVLMSTHPLVGLTDKAQAAVRAAACVEARAAAQRAGTTAAIHEALGSAEKATPFHNGLGAAEQAASAMVKFGAAVARDMPQLAPGGRYACPVHECPQTWDIPEPTVDASDADVMAMRLSVTGVKVTQVDAVVSQHLAGHSVLEFVATIKRLESLLAQARATIEAQAQQQG